ncbi:hypothetical protein BT69DRAFT_1299739 [Atractiella rhizophila]|nr:hypothetical protein BT69DRAFT_1299739 [Atractiella rhizophila]
MSVRADITSGNNRPDIACVGSANIAEAVNPIWRRSQPAHINPSNPRTHPLPGFTRYGLSFCSNESQRSAAFLPSSPKHEHGARHLTTMDQSVPPTIGFSTTLQNSKQRCHTRFPFVEMALRVQTGRKFATETQA